MTVVSGKKRRLSKDDDSVMSGASTSTKRQLPDVDAVVDKSDGLRACSQCSVCIGRGIHVG